MKPSLQDIEWVVRTKFKLTREQIRLPRQGSTRKIFRPRQIAMFLARELNGASYPKIGQYWGRDHTTAVAAYRRIQSLVQANPKVAGHVEECRAALASVTPRRAAEAQYIAQLQHGEISWPVPHLPAGE